MTTSASARLCAAGWAAAVLIGVTAGCAPAGSPETSADPITVGRPPLGGFEAQVQEQIGQQFDRVAATPREPGEALGREYGRLGQILLAYGFPDRARDALSNAVALDPAELRWLHLLGYLEHQAGNYTESELAYRGALALEADNLPVLLRLVEVTAAAGELDDAAEFLARAARIAPDAPMVNFRLGEAALRQGDPASAVQHFQAALERSSGSTAVHYQLARAYQLLGDADNARRHMELRGDVHVPPPDPIVYELELTKRGSGALRHLAERLMSAGRFREAADAFALAIEAAPDDAALYLNWGAALGEIGNNEVARRAFERALELDPTNAQTHFNVAMLHLKDGDGAAALDRLMEATRRDPGNVRASQMTGELLRQSGRCLEAITYFKTVLEARPANGPARLQAAICHTAMGDYEAARALLEEGHQAAPDEQPLIDALARVLASGPDSSLRDGERALALARQLDVGSVGPAATETLAMALAAAGQFAEAAELQGQLIAALSRGQQARRGEWLAHLSANLERYRAGEPCSSAWPPLMYGERGAR